jgi:hypothetical protein
MKKEITKKKFANQKNERQNKLKNKIQAIFWQANQRKTNWKHTV